LGSDINKAVIKGLFGAVVLWLLSKKSMYGYELMKKLSGLINGKLGPSVVYTLLYRLEEAELIEGVWKMVGKRRRVRYYNITEKGLAVLDKIKKTLSSKLRSFIEELLEESV